MERVITVIAGIGLAALLTTGAAGSIPSAEPDGGEAPVVELREAVTAPSASEGAVPAVPAVEPSDEPPNLPVAEPGIRGGSSADRRLVEESVRRLEGSGLAVPPIAVTIHDSLDGCRGFNGLYRSGEIDLVDICHVSEYVVLHELAHAWEHTRVTDIVRDDFLTMAELDAWTGDDIAWKKRGVERAANVVAIALWSSGPRCDGLYETLTGMPCPDAQG